MQLQLLVGRAKALDIVVSISSVCTACHNTFDEVSTLVKLVALLS